MLDAAELAQIQSDLVAAACDKTCIIQRGTATRDIYGNATEASYATVHTTVCGMKQPGASLLQNYDYRVGSLATWLVVLPYGTDVLVDDHLIIESQTLSVHVLLNPHSIPGLSVILAAEMK